MSRLAKESSDIRPKPLGSRQREIVEQLRAHFRPKGGRALFFVTVVRTEWLRRRWNLSEGDVPIIQRWAGRQLRALPGDVRAAGCVEVNLNVISNRRFRWSPHIHLLVEMDGPEAEAIRHLRSRFKGASSRRDAIYRTCVIKPVHPQDQLNGLLRYITKSESLASSVRRSVYYNEDGRRSTRRFSLSRSQASELVQAWGQPTALSRLVLAGLRRPRGGTTIVAVMGPREPTQGELRRPNAELASAACTRGPSKGQPEKRPLQRTKAKRRI